MMASVGLLLVTLNFISSEKLQSAVKGRKPSVHRDIFSDCIKVLKDMKSRCMLH